MGILDLSLVTKSLLNLLECAFSTSAEIGVADITFSSQRPDQVKGNVVGLYLYHVIEDPGYKNLPAPEDASAHIRHSPMGLDLHYQLVCQYLSTPEDPETAICEQNMMGIAIKTLHDHPIIDDGTMIKKKNPSLLITDENVLVPKLLGTGTRLKIEMLPVDQKDAMGYWATSNAAPRLAAYYKVSVVVLKREMPPTRPGRVLSYGVFSFPGGAPRIDGCSNTISYRLPGNTSDTTVELTPAQVPVGMELCFRVAGFSGEKSELLIKYSKWEDFYPVETAWSLSISDQRAMISIQKTIPDGTGNNIQILPGIYSARLRVTKSTTLSDGSTGQTEHLSNECPFVITPRIDSVGSIIEITPDQLYDCEIKGYMFSYVNPPGSVEQLTVQVYVGSIKYRQGSTAGSFEVAAADNEKIILHLPKMVPGVYPVRVFVNGAESTPAWITVN